jgi:hypothetical protein
MTKIKHQIKKKVITKKAKQNIAIKKNAEKSGITFKKPQVEEEENIIKDDIKTNDIDDASSEETSPIIKKQWKVFHCF